MYKFREYLINESIFPEAMGEECTTDIRLESERDNINIILNSVLSDDYVNPYVALERVQRVLSGFHIFLPPSIYLEGEWGIHAYGINQYGNKIGMDDQGNFKVSDHSPYFVYFEYLVNEDGKFDIFCEIVNQDELDELLEDTEDEDENEEI